MDGINYSNLLIGLITLLISYTVLKIFKKNKIIINLSLIVLLVLGAVLLKSNETMQIIFGSIFGAVLINIIDYFYDQKKR
ncbi:hypothetical protein [Helcococcus massiliensis]|uniref:hypothetical protein n=1 Tax=Helcococcus massiliensis TaxID=2040290 RepID=UPI000CDE9C25|nr:hypothetical protein [Helcococcus massiliensis]